MTNCCHYCAQGEKGDVGNPGRPGNVGSKGPPGVQGVRGARGPNGPNGVDGRAGDPGDSGPDGAQVRETIVGIHHTSLKIEPGHGALGYYVSPPCCRVLRVGLEALVQLEPREQQDSVVLMAHQGRGVRRGVWEPLERGAARGCRESQARQGLQG